MNKIIIEFGKNTSENDEEDLKVLLEDISKRYNFRWFNSPQGSSGEEVRDKKPRVDTPPMKSKLSDEDTSKSTEAKIKKEFYKGV